MQLFIFGQPSQNSALLSQFVRNNLNSIGTLNSGDTEPSAPQTGMPWLDTSSAPTTYYLKVYTGTSWLTIAQYPITVGDADVERLTVSTASATWTLNHNLGYTPVSVQCFDILGNKITPSNINVLNVNVATVTHPFALAGSAIVIG